MFRFLFFIILSGCSHHNPQPSDTKFDESKIDWEQIYINEINSAIENVDTDAFNFFMRELILETNYLNN